MFGILATLVILHTAHSAPGQDAEAKTRRTKRSGKLSQLTAVEQDILNMLQDKFFKKATSQDAVEQNNTQNKKITAFKQDFNAKDAKTENCASGVIFVNPFSQTSVEGAPGGSPVTGGFPSLGGAGSAGKK